MRIAHLILIGTASLTLQGCLAKTAFNVATAPVRIVSKGVDLATTSQSEADEKRGREVRKREERVGKLDRRYEKQRKDCLDGERSACDDARRTYEEMQVLVRSLPAESGDGED
ncbi:MAG: hypothetical protein EX262_00440 [Sphingomonadaceae bacterium]|jgi:hypothetical protein|nr:MAG: hypothetical protein EX262_00440 [Sphingomonadaceae bacterium]